MVRFGLRIAGNPLEEPGSFAPEKMIVYKERLRPAPGKRNGPGPLAKENG